MDPLRLEWRWDFLIDPDAVRTRGATLHMPAFIRGEILTGTNGKVIREEVPVTFCGGASGRRDVLLFLRGVDGRV